jgi:hypothetical protein
MVKFNIDEVLTITIYCDYVVRTNPYRRCMDELEESGLAGRSFALGIIH